MQINDGRHLLEKIPFASALTFRSLILTFVIQIAHLHNLSLQALGNAYTGVGGGTAFCNRQKCLGKGSAWWHLSEPVH